jgi:potassium-dependent mechanosensitive channel
LLADQGSMAASAAGEQYLIRLRELKFVYQGLLNALKKSTTMAAEKSRLEKAAESGRAFLITEQKPYSLSLYDGTLDGIATLNQEQALLQASQKNAQLKLEQSRQTLEKAEQAWRRVKEKTPGGQPENTKQGAQLAKADLDREIAAANVELAQERLNEYQRKMDLVALKRVAADQKLDTIRNDLAFDPAALDRVMAGIDAQKNQVDRYLQSVIEAQRQFEAQWQVDQRHDLPKNVIERALNAREAWQHTYETTLQQTEEMTRLLNRQQQLWQYRYALLKGDMASSDLNLWDTEATATGQQVQQAIRSYQTSQVNLHARMDAAEKDRDGLNAAARKYATHKLDALKETNAVGQAYLSLLLATEQLSSRLLDEININERPISIWDRVIETGSRFDNLWNFELWVIDEHGVTVGKLITALGILIIGVILIKQTTRILVGRMKKANLELSRTAAVEKLLFYLGFLLVLLFALKIVNIPLTAFTFLGGAFAIGLGFGAQNLINNFISGFIIMAERPIKIGDILELEGQCVRVEEIGARCTRVRTGQNIHILVPNSSFLENDIINWTLSDSRIRTCVTIGVAYGSPVEQVRELLLEAAEKIDQVLDNPPPFVVFDEFGDNALIFEIYFWIRVENVIEKKKIASTLRYRIYALFNDNDIVIAYPQRDVHLDTVSPVKVQLLESVDRKE